MILNSHSQRLLKTISYLIAAILLSLNVSQAQQPDAAPFIIFEKAIKDERGGSAGNKERLSTVFNAERKRLGDRFESELMTWLGSDVERHYWISFFLESESYLHGSKPLLHLSLLVKQQDSIESSLSRKITTVVVGDNNPPPKAKVSGGVLNGKAINLVKPSYPAAGRASGASGKVEVQIVFDETGKVIWARAISGHPDLRQAAEDAAWRTTFSPLRLSGQPVTVGGVLVYNFVL